MLIVVFLNYFFKVLQSFIAHQKVKKRSPETTLLLKTITLKRGSDLYRVRLTSTTRHLDQHLKLLDWHFDVLKV